MIAHSIDKVLRTTDLTHTRTSTSITYGLLAAPSSPFLPKSAKYIHYLSFLYVFRLEFPQIKVFVQKSAIFYVAELSKFCSRHKYMNCSFLKGLSNEIN